MNAHLGCIPGFALDLTTVDENGDQWNFSLEHMGRKAEKMIDHPRKMLERLGHSFCFRFGPLFSFFRVQEVIDLLLKDRERQGSSDKFHDFHAPIWFSVAQQK